MLEESVLFQKQMEEGKVCYGIDFKKKIKSWFAYEMWENG